MISPETIRTILENANIAEVISDFVKLKRKGSNLGGLCPFHNEKTPSFYVSPAKGIFKCFGCGKAGNVVNFIMEHEHFTYPEALRYLAKRFNIPIEEEEQTVEQIQAQTELESLFNLNLFAKNWFVNQLQQSDEGKSVALGYLRSRGIRDDIVSKFEIGYAPNKWEEFTQYALQSGYKSDFLISTGLSIISDQKIHDRFRGRIIFPFHNITGRILGFGGRILPGDKSPAKYLNSPESTVYQKSKTLYGLYFAKNAIIQQDNCFLVEGYMDVISLFQAGIENVVASSGTSLTSDQVKLIKRYTSNVTILYDGDPAGIKAAFRGIDLVLEEGMHVKIVLFPEGEDPDSFAQKHRPKEVKEFLASNAHNFIIFKTELLLREAQNDPVKRASLIKDIVASIANVPDPITRTVYVKECSAIMAIKEQALMNELNKQLRNKFKEKFQSNDVGLPENIVYATPSQAFTDEDDHDIQEKNIIRLLVCYGTKKIPIQVDRNQDVRRPRRRLEAMTEEKTVAQLLISEIKEDEILFKNPIYQKIFNEFANGLNRGEIPDEPYFIYHPDASIAELAVDLISSPYALSENWKNRHKIFVPTEENTLVLAQAVITSLYAFKAKFVDDTIIELQNRLKENLREKELMQVMEEIKRWKEISVKINKGLDRIIVK